MSERSGPNLIETAATCAVIVLLGLFFSVIAIGISVDRDLHQIHDALTTTTTTSVGK